MQSKTTIADFTRVEFLTENPPFERMNMCHRHGSLLMIPFKGPNSCLNFSEDGGIIGIVVYKNLMRDQSTVTDRP